MDRLVRGSVGTAQWVPVGGRNGERDGREGGRGDCHGWRDRGSCRFGESCRFAYVGGSGVAGRREESETDGGNQRGEVDGRWGGGVTLTLEQIELAVAFDLAHNYCVVGDMVLEQIGSCLIGGLMSAI